MSVCVDLVSVCDRVEISYFYWSKRVCVLLVVSLLFDLSVCLCRPECLSVTGLRFTYFYQKYITARTVTPFLSTIETHETVAKLSIR